MAQMSIFNEDNPEQGEIEYKTASAGRLPEDMWELVTGYANAEGGKVVFGVDPRGKSIDLKPEEIDLIQRNLQSDCATAYSHKINPAITVQGGTVSAYIPPSPAAIRPIYSSKRGLPKGAKVRVGSSNVQVDDEWMRRFAIAAKGGAETLVFDGGDYTEILNMEEIETYIAQINARRGGVYSNYSTEEIIRKLRIVDKEGKVTMFGLLAFSNDAYLQDIVSPTLTVVVTQYPGATKLAGPGNETYLDNREFYGPVKKQFEGSLTFLLSKIPIRGVLSDSGMRTDQYLIPYKAVREALANTIAHRDYGVHSSRIQIDIYADRIEFINPGRSLVPIEDLETAPSMSRNPLLMNYLREVGATEQLARGIRTIKYELREAGLQAPTFANIANSFVATIYHSAFISQVDRAWLNQFKDYRLNERQTTCLAALKQSKNGISNREYREVNGMNKMGDDKLANKDLKRMVEKGILRKEGENKATRYYIVEAFL